MKKEIITKPLLSDEHIGQYFFSDEFGVAMRDPLGVGDVVLKDGRTLSATKLLIPMGDESGERFENFPSAPSCDDLKRLFKEGAFLLKKIPSPMLYYRDSSAPTKENTELVKIQSITVYINARVLKESHSLVSQSYELVLEDVSDINDDLCVCLGENFPQIHQIDAERLAVGQVFYLLLKGKAVITKIYDYRKPSLLCQVQLFDESLFDVSVDAVSQLLYLPYEEYNDEFEELRISKNEWRLSAVLAKDPSHGVSTFYWREIPEAARYIVSLYAITTYLGKKRLYHLTNIEVERNARYLVLPHIAGEFACKVIAEDREGGQVAVSRASYGTNK